MIPITYGYARVSMSRAAGDGGPGAPIVVDSAAEPAPAFAGAGSAGSGPSSLYYRPREASGENLALMQAMDRQYLDTPFYGSRLMKVWLAREGRCVSWKRVQRLMRIMGLWAIYRSPRTNRPAPEHRVYPYLLEKIRVTRPNQAWAADITYLPMTRGFLYLMAIMDWHSRYVVAWRLSNTLAGLCAIQAA